MYICENCGKEVLLNYGSNRFCSKECARGFSTKAKRLEINKKIANKLKGVRLLSRFPLPIKELNVIREKNIIVARKCVSCGEEIKKTCTYCNKCFKFWRYKPMFEKLNIYEPNILIANDKAVNLLKEEYFINKLSLPLIRDKYGIQFNTIHFFFKKNEISLRNLAESSEIAFINNRIKVCSNPKYKHGWHTTWNNKQVYLRSSYEFDYAKELDDHKLDYEVETKRIQYFDTERNKNRVAIPDFYLIDLNMIVEIKCSYTLNLQNMKDKFLKYKELGYKTKLILDFKELEI